MQFDKLVSLYESPAGMYNVSGTIVFTNPFNTTPKHENNVNEIVTANSPEQAVLVAAKRISKRNGFLNSYFKKNYGYKVTPYTPPGKYKQTEFGLKF
jgi:hypothetical protein